MPGKAFNAEVVCLEPTTLRGVQPEPRLERSFRSDMTPA